jgi:uncharacterized membrane protein YfcA
MDLLQLLILAVLGTLGGALSGVAGVGGGIVFVPTLVYAAGWDIKEAVAASLVIVVFSSLSGTIRKGTSGARIRSTGEPRPYSPSRWRRRP